MEMVLFSFCSATECGAIIFSVAYGATISAAWTGGTGIDI
jgi:hypothetical protein